MKNQQAKKRRTTRVRAKLGPSIDRPRISVYRSNKYFYAQVINPEKGDVLASSSSFEIRKNAKVKNKKSEEAKSVGLELAKKLKKKGVTKGILDRGSYAYLGRVQAFAQGLREGGIDI
ncbi:50S ribosomal protein L18 [Candidatus Roizmanbacteria bacterium]|nr:50S ribosomal protein L18 [Candidatus Roizmanbacteria bacterium]